MTSQHEVLYRSARPRTFGAVKGQASVVNSITKAIVQERVPHAILLAGHFGCGKTTIARLIAAAVNCEHRAEGSADPCGSVGPCERCNKAHENRVDDVCQTCSGVLEGAQSIAVTEVDAASKRNIQSVRDLIATMSERTNARYKVYIIDEAHKLTGDAADTLLKTLEEPPEGVIIILASTQANQIGGPILSRLTRYSISALGDREIEALVRETAESSGIELDDSDVTAILSRSENSARTALNLLERWGNDSADSDGDEEEPASLRAPAFLRGMTQAIADSDFSSIIVLLSEQFAAGRTPESCTKLLIDHFRECIIASQAPKSLTSIGDMRVAAEEGAELLNRGILINLLQRLLSGSRHSSSPDARLALETALMEAIWRGQSSSGGKSAASGGLTDERLDELAERVAAIVIEQIGSAAIAPPSTTEDPEEDEPEPKKSKPEKKPEPEPSDDTEDEDEADDGQDSDSSDDDATPRVPFDEDKFMDIFADALSRRGQVLVSRYGDLSVDKKKADVLVMDTSKASRPMLDSDLDSLTDAAKSLGWEIELIDPPADDGDDS